MLGDVLEVFVGTQKKAVVGDGDRRNLAVYGGSRDALGSTLSADLGRENGLLTAHLEEGERVKEVLDFAEVLLLTETLQYFLDDESGQEDLVVVMERSPEKVCNWIAEAYILAKPLRPDGCVNQNSHRSLRRAL